MMSDAQFDSCSVSTAALREAIEACCAASLPGAGSVLGIARRTSAYRSSFPLEELEVEFAGGRQLSLVFKNLGWEGLADDARRTKPRWLYEPRREIEIYRQVLSSRKLGTATCYGTVCVPAADRYWLFLERVPGVELYQVGAFEVWRHAARALAEMHTVLAGGEVLASTSTLVHHDETFFRSWLERARRFLTERRQRIGAQSIDRLVSVFDRAIRRVAALPSGLIHGEFYASNVLVGRAEAGDPSRPRVCPIDWEMAGIGPGLVDLAALTSGKWTATQRRALAAAYLEALPPGSAFRAQPEEFFARLDDCRLCLCVQWLGWSPDWTPPAEHAHDWLSEALRLAEAMGR
jgi:hypothetical protein